MFPWSEINVMRRADRLTTPMLLGAAMLAACLPGGRAAAAEAATNVAP